jgi:hypothetical protein
MIMVMLHDLANEEQAVVPDLSLCGVRDGAQHVLKSVTEVITEVVFELLPDWRDCQVYNQGGL